MIMFSCQSPFEIVKINYGCQWYVKIGVDEVYTYVETHLRHFYEMYSD